MEVTAVRRCTVCGVRKLLTSFAVRDGRWRNRRCFKCVSARSNPMPSRGTIQRARGIAITAKGRAALAEMRETV